ncbi:MAG TPA: hypothetical protein VFV75_17985 [Candidatus Polarisedimenticolaceae bacterium]|nr:hypothetical protein [Candidatus Polarisedimenticolaceae bacterium]
MPEKREKRTGTAFVHEVVAKLGGANADLGKAMDRLHRTHSPADFGSVRRAIDRQHALLQQLKETLLARE